MITIRNIHLRRGGKQILESVDLDLPTGTFNVIIGSNGAGKTSLLEVLTGQLTPQEGTITWENELFKNWPIEKMAMHRTVLSQHVQVGFPIRVADLVALGSYAVRDTISSQENDSMVHYALKEVGMTAFKDRNYSSLSGGEQQRVLLAKCIVQLESNYWRPHTQYLFLDEATASLDIKQKHQVMRLVRKIIRRRAIGVVAIVHDLALAAKYADRIILLKQGKVLAQGNCVTTLTSANLSKTFDLVGDEIPYLPCNKQALTL